MTAHVNLDWLITDLFSTVLCSPPGPDGSLAPVQHRSSIASDCNDTQKRCLSSFGTSVILHVTHLLEITSANQLTQHATGEGERWEGGREQRKEGSEELFSLVLSLQICRSILFKAKLEAVPFKQPGYCSTRAFVALKNPWFVCESIISLSHRLEGIFFICWFDPKQQDFPCSYPPKCRLSVSGRRALTSYLVEVRDFPAKPWKHGFAIFSPPHWPMPFWILSSQDNRRTVAENLLSFQPSILIQRSERQSVGWPGRSRPGCRIIGNIWKTCPLWPLLWPTHKWDRTCLMLRFKWWCVFYVHVHFVAAAFYTSFSTSPFVAFSIRLLGKQDDVCSCIYPAGAQEDTHAGSTETSASSFSMSRCLPLCFLLPSLCSISSALPTRWERPGWSFSGLRG